MIDHDPSDVRATTTRLFENAEWRVLDEGLEHRATGYFIGRDTIGMRRGALWEWPLHLAEKNWCRAGSFRQAFMAALDAFGAVADAELARSFTIGFGLVAGAGSRSAASTVGVEDFVALGDLVRPKPTPQGLPRKRAAASEPRATARRAGMPVPQRIGDTAHQRARL